MFRLSSRKTASRLCPPAFRRGLRLEWLEDRATPALVSGFVFEDLNQNDTFDTGESGVSGVTVFADLDDSGTLNGTEPSDVTAADGSYSIDAGTATGTVTIAVEAPTGFTAGTATADLSGGDVTDANVALAATGGTVSGTVFVDADNDGTPDSGEGRSGVTVFLDANGNGALDSGEVSATTDANGQYSLTAAENGTVTIQVVAPSGFTLAGTAPTVDLNDGDTVTGKNIELQADSTGATGGTVSGTVFADVEDTDGEQGDDENGVRGITVYLDLNDNGKLDRGEPRDVTDSDGEYTLTTTEDVTDAAVRVVLSPGYLRSTTRLRVDLTGGDTVTDQDIALTTNLPPQATPARRLAAGYVIGGKAHVKTFDDDGDEEGDVEVFPGQNMGDVRVAVADVTGDGVDDVVVGTGPGVPAQVVVLDGTNLQEVARITPFEPTFTGGVFVATGDVDRDGINDIVVTPDEGGGARVVVYKGGPVGAADSFTEIASFFGIEDVNFRGGARAALADIDKDGVPDLVVVAGFGGGPRVAVYDGNSILSGIARLVNDFFVFEQTLRNGVYVTAGDLDGDGFADLIVGGGPGGAPRVLALNGHDLVAGQGVNSGVLANFFAGDDHNRGGVRVVAKDTDGDGRAEIFTGGGEGESGHVRKFHGNGKKDDKFDDDFGGNSGVFVG